jgi:3-hydroxyisobutyrate dehydrogenase-like beta-hydroxyacid dehydrogenase
VAALRPWQLRIGARIFVLGETPGQAQVMKLVNNLVFAANMVSTCEALVMGAKAGLDADTMVAMLNAGTGRSMVSEKVMETVLSGEFRFGAAMSILDKDVSLGIAEAGAMKVPMWALEQAARVWRLAMVAEGPEQDISTVIRMMEGWAGAEVRRRAE